MLDVLNRLRRRRSIWLRVCLASAIAAVLAGGAAPAAAQDDAGLPGQEEPDKAPKGEKESPLPSGYVPPADPPEDMLIDSPLLDLSDEELKQMRRDVRKKCLPRLRSGDMRGEAARAEVVNGIRSLLNDLTIAKEKKDLPKIRQKLTGSGGILKYAGSFLGKQSQIVDFRREVMQIVVDETAKLFDKNRLVRIQAAILLGELNLVEEDAPKDIKAEPFPPAYKPLCQALLDPEQPTDVKISCVLSLIRIVRHGNPNVEQKRDIAEAIIAELKNPQTHWWCQMRLAEALGYIDTPRDLNNQSFIHNALLSVVQDPNRPMRVRVQAAWSLGRHPEKGDNVPQMVADIAALGYDLAQKQAKTPKDPEWKSCALWLYLAFEKQNDQDLDAKRDPTRKGGLLNHPVTAAAAQAAFQKLVPILSEIIANKTPTQKQVQDLKSWLDTQPNADKSEGRPTPSVGGGPSPLPKT